MKAIVHIGTPKTGTTSAQSWFSQHRPLLQENGIFYPLSLGHHHHIRLSTACRSADRPERGFRIFDIKSPRDHAIFVEHTFAIFEKELAKATASRTCLISSEWFYDRLTQAPERAMLRVFLERFFEDFLIIVWLRPQVDYISSFASTICRNGGVFDAARLEALQTSPALQYDTVLSEWEEVMGPERVIVMPYKREKDIIRTLLAKAGASIDIEDEASRENTRLSVEVISLGNQIRLPHANREYDSGFDRRAYFNNIKSKSPLKISIQQAEGMHADYIDGNQRLADRHKTITAEDLEPEWKQYGEKGNLDRLNIRVSFAPELTQLVGMMNSDLQIQRALTALALAELDHVRGENGQPHLDRAERFIDAASKGQCLPARLEGARKNMFRVRRLLNQKLPD